MEEEWKIINEFPDYKISNTGKIISFKCNKVKEIGKKSNYNNGYITVTLFNKNKIKSFLKHRLVAEHFIPNPNKNKEINHIDGNKSNNHISNLEWISHIKNIKHAYKNQLMNVDNRKKISDEDFIKIRQEFIPYKNTISMLAKQYNVSKQTIQKVLYDTTYRMYIQ